MPNTTPKMVMLGGEQNPTQPENATFPGERWHFKKFLTFVETTS
jgi:hypothetical protein